MRVSEIMRRDVVSVPPSATIAEVAKKMREGNIRFVPVFERGRVLGVICDRDIVTKVVANDIEPSNCHASLFTVAQSALATIEPEADLIEAAKLMGERRLSCLCVVDDNKLVGIVSLADIARVSETVGGVVLRKLSNKVTEDSLSQVA